MDKLFAKLSDATMAALIAVLSGLGVGSGGLLVIWLTMIDGIDAETARGFNLLFFVFSASTALLVHLLRGRIKLLLVGVLALFACIGTFIGTYLGTRVDPYWLKKIFGGMLVLTGSYTIFKTLPRLFIRRKKSEFF